MNKAGAHRGSVFPILHLDDEVWALETLSDLDVTFYGSEDSELLIQVHGETLFRVEQMKDEELDRDSLGGVRYVPLSEKMELDPRFDQRGGIPYPSAEWTAHMQFMGVIVEAHHALTNAVNALRFAGKEQRSRRLKEAGVNL